MQNSLDFQMLLLFGMRYLVLLAPLEKTQVVSLEHSPTKHVNYFVKREDYLVIENVVLV